MPPKVTLEPQSEEEVKIKFLPLHPGTYMLKVELLVTSLIKDETTVRWQRLPSVLNLDGVSETPDLEFLFRDERFLDFGEMSYGSSSRKELTILNKGRADVPLHVLIEEVSFSTKNFSLYYSLV